MVISSAFEQARAVERRVLEEMQRHEYSEVAAFAVKLALEESLNNAIRHGNCGDRCKCIEVRFEVNRKQVTVSVMDEGSGFNPCTVPDPTADENIEKPSGRGIMLMRAYMDEVTHNSQGNQVTMVKYNN